MRKWSSAFNDTQSNLRVVSLLAFSVGPDPVWQLILHVAMAHAAFYPNNMDA